MYRLIAFDMDGTLLRSDKTVSPAVLEAIHEALRRGKYVALATGRPVAELFPYRRILADCRYAVLESGALIYEADAKSVSAGEGIPEKSAEKSAQEERSGGNQLSGKEELPVPSEDADPDGRILLRHTLDPACIPMILEAVSHEDVMPQAMCGGRSYISASDLHRMEYYHMGVYETLYERSATLVPEIRDFIRTCPDGIEKINLYHASAEGRRRTAERLCTAPIQKTYAEQTSLELSPPGIHKGSGLRELCHLLGLSAEEAVAVGDADNDIPMLLEAGCGVAMDNAGENVKDAADRIVAGNDFDGCAEAIWKILLGDEAGH